MTDRPDREWLEHLIQCDFLKLETYGSSLHGHEHSGFIIVKVSEIEYVKFNKSEPEYCAICFKSGEFERVKVAQNTEKMFQLGK